jgi:hypothetical protein
MIRVLVIVAALGSVGGFAGLATAQNKPGEAFGTDVSSQCAQISDPRVKDDCVRKLRNDRTLVAGALRPAVQVAAKLPGLGVALDLGREVKARAANRTFRLPTLASL